MSRSNNEKTVLIKGGINLRSLRSKHDENCTETVTSSDEDYNTSVVNSLGHSSEFKDTSWSDITTPVDDCLVSFQPISASISISDGFTISSICSHPNIASTYGVTFDASGAMLVIEKVETSLSSLLCDKTKVMTVYEKVNLAFGILSAMGYFHHHLEVPYGLLTGDTVFVTSNLRAKLLDPSAVYMLTGKTPDPGTSLEDDMVQLMSLLQSVLEDDCPALKSACSRLRSMAIMLNRGSRGYSYLSTFHMAAVLDSVRQSVGYYSSVPQSR
jgi:hypothetical protein